MKQPSINLFHMLRDSDDHPTLDAFYNWVDGSVLPSILATGGYVLREEYRTFASADDLALMPLPAAAKPSTRPRT
ncbi:hypothetical protein [Sphingomonas sp. BK580]|uniref:hypothetical protein n=1 Tax=Sphingomonas sp. BK580 TaxID=2586972 RepID=UPI0016136FB3|nr:hypothetical protein [Sphingomonas sp. BK580]MBB3692446.1 hypothetical protein [Sphingomonas sp. BK580]